MVCGLLRFRSTALVNEVTATGTGKESLVYRTNRGMRKGVDKFNGGTEGHDKVERGGNPVEGRTHTGLMYSNIFAMKPLY